MKQLCLDFFLADSFFKDGVGGIIFMLDFFCSK